MGELPEGVSLPAARIVEPRPSASVMVSRSSDSGGEILLAHRVSEVPAFPDFWAFPGGGVSREDRTALQENPQWFASRDEEERLALCALLRELVEEVGFSPDGNGGLVAVDAAVRSRICDDKAAWADEVCSGRLIADGTGFSVITHRITPPLAPIRFDNRFFHFHLHSPANEDASEDALEPTIPSGRAEFDEFRWWQPHALLKAWLAHELRIPPPLLTLIRDLCEIMDTKDYDVVTACEFLANDVPSGGHRIEFAPGVECIPLPTDTLPPATHTNCYVLGEPGGERVIIDAAAVSQQSLDELAAKISEILASGSTILATIFTHRHPDHIGDLAKISELYTAPIWATSETHEAIPRCDTDKILCEGDSFTLNGPSGKVTWQVVVTPGHCPGHLCLVGEAGIISGDNCVQFGTILVPSSDGDMNSYLSGLARLRDLSPRLLFPAHGPMVANPARLLNHYIEHRSSRHQAVLKAVQSGESRLESIAEIAYSNTPEAHPMLKVDQTLSHLLAHENNGFIEQTAGGWAAL
jgi:glyoxylase-like metal-dependent hydrolase (beta-lactamase superfamily II)/8-oxo-dGTP pyrophosphatase MutT (NUDIX family)